MISDSISLRGIEVFVAVARQGSVAAAAPVLGLSVAAVSQQLRSLEDALERPLLDHARRPMRLTATGEIFLRRAEEALNQLRRASAEARVSELANLRSLRLGVIDDFDQTITPALANFLSESMSDCALRLDSRPSLELCDLILKGELDAALAARAQGMSNRLPEIPLLEDPFVLILPRGHAKPGANFAADLADLPFLRFERSQLIAQQIAAELELRQIDPVNHFELGSNGSLNALVAAGKGWAISTALSWLQSPHLDDQITSLPLPGRAGGRVISLFHGHDVAEKVTDDLSKALRDLIEFHAIAPAIERAPWLRGVLRAV